MATTRKAILFPKYLGFGTCVAVIFMVCLQFAINKIELTIEQKNRSYLKGCKRNHVSNVLLKYIMAYIGKLQLFDGLFSVPKSESMIVVSNTVLVPRSFCTKKSKGSRLDLFGTPGSLLDKTKISIKLVKLA